MAFTLKEKTFSSSTRSRVEVESVAEPEREFGRSGLRPERTKANPSRPINTDTTPLHFNRRHPSCHRTTQTRKQHSYGRLVGYEEGRRSSRKNQKDMGGWISKRSARLKVSFRHPKSQSSVTLDSNCFQAFTVERTCVYHTSILVLLTIAFHPPDSLVCASAQPKFAYVHGCTAQKASFDKSIALSLSFFCVQLLHHRYYEFSY